MINVPACENLSNYANTPFKIKADRYILEEGLYNTQGGQKKAYLQSQKKVYNHLLNNPSIKDWMTLFIRKPNEIGKIRRANRIVLPNSFLCAEETENAKLLKNIGGVLRDKYPFSGAIREKLIKMGRLKADTVTRSPQGILQKAIRKLKVIL